MPQSNGKSTVRWIGILVTLFSLAIIGTTGFLNAQSSKLDKEKLDIMVFDAHKEAQAQQFKSVLDHQSSEFKHVQKSLGKIERKLGIYDPEDTE